VFVRVVHAMVRRGQPASAIRSIREDFFSVHDAVEEPLSVRDGVEEPLRALRWTHETQYGLAYWDEAHSLPESRSLPSV
jgi:hypothetical protein